MYLHFRASRVFFHTVYLYYNQKYVFINYYYILYIILLLFMCMTMNI